jgi:hypothetical protein
VVGVGEEGEEEVVAEGSEERWAIARLSLPEG